MQHRWGVFAITSGSMLTWAMQFSMVSVALPEITSDLDSPIRWSGWVLTAFMVAQVVSLPIAGRLSERFGSRNVFVVGFACFATASLISALAPNIGVLIVGRAIQGAGGGVLMPAGMGMVSESFGEDRYRPIGLMGSVLPIGGIIGPSLGGAIVDSVGWRYTFALNVPIGVVVVAVGLLFLPKGERRPTGPIDLPGIALLSVSLTALIFALTELGQRDTSPSYLLVTLASATFVLAMLLFAGRQLRAATPIVDIELLRRRELMFANLLAFGIGVALFSVAQLLPFYFEKGYEMTAAESGLLLTPRSMAMVATSAVSAMVLMATGIRRPLLSGMLLMAVTLMLLSRGFEEPTLLGLEVSNFVWLTMVVVLMGVAFGMTMPSLNNAALDAAPDRIPAITGLRGMFMTLGGVVGVSVILLVVSRGDSEAAALEASFVGLAVILVAATLLLPGIPELGGGRRPATREGVPPVPQHAGGAPTVRRSD